MLSRKKMESEISRLRRQVALCKKSMSEMDEYIQTRRTQERLYLPTLSDLVDRLSIVQMKAIFIPERKDEYRAERQAIEWDIDLLLEGKTITARSIHAILMIALSNRVIWENESRAREGGDDQDKLLKLTHSINGVRNTAKNVLAEMDGGRKDYKIDCFAASLVEQFGDWNIW